MAGMNIVASIVGVASAGFRLSLILNAINCEISQAPIEIHHISKTVTLLSLMLKHTGTALQAPNSVHSQDAVEASKHVADESRRVFDEINELLDKVRNRKEEGSSQPSAQQRIKWCFKKTRINYLLAQLDSLKLSLTLISQVLQLGKVMASTSRSDTPAMVQDKAAAMQQERAEIQNTLVVRYLQIRETEELYRVYESEDKLPQPSVDYKGETDTDSDVTVKPPPEYLATTNLTRISPHSLQDVDPMLVHLDNSSKDMIRISSQAIDPLLEKWTKWREVRENRHTRSSGGRYTATVDILQEEEPEFHERYRERDDSPRGYHLEGITTDWRKPNSIVARQEYSRRRKIYADYQPSVSGHSSDQDSSPNNGVAKRKSAHHIINSSSDSSDSEAEVPKKNVKFKPGPPLERPSEQPTTQQQTTSASTPPNGQMPPRMPPSPAQSVDGKNHYSPQHRLPPNQRPFATPDQNMYHQHSRSMPLPPIHTYNAPNPYAQGSPQPSSYMYPPYHNQQPGMAQTLRPPPSTPDRMNVNTRPISRDGKGGRSPSRLSQEIPQDYDWETYRDRDRYRDYDRDRPHDKERDRERDRNYDRDRNREYSSKEKRSKDKHKALRDGATKGLLGGLTLGTFLEMLEGLEI